MLRHAYLILAHEYTLTLKRLIQMLDYDNNGLYIHIDKNGNFANMDLLIKTARRAKVYVYRKYKVYWGTNSITDAQIYLLVQAVKGNYDYCHILSGADLPIKTHGQIQEFFEKNNGMEFIHFGTQQYQQDIQQRYNIYHFFSKQLGRNRDKKFWVDVETYSLAIQRRLHIDRTRKLKFSIYGGSNWCSMTNGLAHYAVKNYAKYRKAFCFSQISDEAVWQTIVMDSPYYQNLYHKNMDNDYRACMRYIDWNRGAPYVFRADDFDSLMQSKCMIARKFDEHIDREIIEMIYHKLGEQDGK